MKNTIERNYASYHLSGVPKPDPINLNKNNTKNGLMTLPGIGDARAQAIITHVNKKTKAGSKYFNYTSLAADSGVPLSVFHKLRGKELIVLN